MLREDDRAEVAEIAESLRELCPLYSPAFEPYIEQVSCRIWRQRRGYRDLSEHGVVRDGQPAPLLVDLAKLERQIARDLAELGMTPRAAAALGVDVARCRVKVSQRLYRGMDAPKSEMSRRVVKISPAMARRLKRLWESRGKPMPHEPVFVSPEGCRLDYSNLYKRIAAAMRAAGIAHGAFHRLRHTTGPELKRRGAGLEQIQLHLGHHDLAFTQRVYVHLDAQEDGPDPELLDDLAGCARATKILRVVSAG